MRYKSIEVSFMKDKLRDFKKALPSPWMIIFLTMFFNTLSFFVPHVPFVLQWLASSLFQLSFIYLIIYWLIPSPIVAPEPEMTQEEWNRWNEYDENYRYWKQIRKE